MAAGSRGYCSSFLFWRLRRSRPKPAGRLDGPDVPPVSDSGGGILLAILPAARSAAGLAVSASRLAASSSCDPGMPPRAPPPPRPGGRAGPAPLPALGAPAAWAAPALPTDAGLPPGRPPLGFFLVFFLP